MSARFAFIGHKNMGRYLERALAGADWQLTSDVENCEVAFTYCTSQSALEDAYFSEEGLIKRLPTGAMMIDLSASTPSFARELSAIASVNDLRPVEAPVVVVDSTVADAFAKDNLACFVAGDAADVEEVCPLLDVLFGSVSDMGACGNAQLARAAFTLQVTAQIVGAIEAAALYKATQKASTSVDHVDATPGGVSPYSASVLAAVVDERFAGTYTIEMLLAEANAAMAAADDVELIVPQIEASMHLIEILAVIGGADFTPAAVSLVFEDEQTCADHGLDWARAEQYYGHDDGCSGDGDCGDDCTCGHHHDDYDDFEYDESDFADFGGYSSN